MPKGKLIVASARLPVTISRRGEAWDVKGSTGGLVTALKSVAESRPFTWLGWAGTTVPETDRATVSRELERHGSIPVWLSKADIEGFYEGFSNRVLWPLFHGLTERVHFSTTAWRVFQRVNQLFADAIVQHAGPHDLIWVHDYQLALVPEMLRRAGVNLPVGHFLHIPFPSAENYRTLPVREDILRGLLGADLLGFHAYEYVSHFRSACLRILGLESEPDVLRLPSRRVHLGVLPIGIDPAEIEQMRTSQDALTELESIRATHADKKVIVGVDRLDYTKGLVEKFMAFEELLRTHSKWRNRVVLIQVAAPSRENVDEYKQLKRDVDEVVGRINGRYSSPSNTPIVYINRSIPRSRLVGLYQAADIALVTPARDGMNLVALEYAAARGEKGGTLVLSEFAGAAHLLAGARLVNPYNIGQVAETLADALEHPAPAGSFSHMLEFINQNTSMLWANHFLARLEVTLAERRSSAVRLHVDEPPASEKVKQATKPLVLLDYDGTLRAFEVKPMDASPSEHLREVLQELAAVATVYIVSGRPGDVLEQWFGDLEIGMVCEHGFSVKAPGGEWEERRAVRSTEGLKRVMPLLEEFVRRTPGSTIERKRSSVAWHYRAADPEWGIFQANELFSLLEDAFRRRPYTVLRGSRVIEVRHQNATKGNATLELLKKHSKCDMLFCAGDDRTDEEMMEAIPRSWKNRTITCWVGGRNANADYWVDTSEELLAELKNMTRTWKKGLAAGAPRRARAAERRRRTR